MISSHSISKFSTSMWTQCVPVLQQTVYTKVGRVRWRQRLWRRRYFGWKCLRALRQVHSKAIPMRKRSILHFKAFPMWRWTGKSSETPFPPWIQVIGNHSHFQHCEDASDEINCKAPICSFGVCSQICLEKKSGNYNCRCVDGYSKGIEKNDTCVSNDQPLLLLIASDRDLRFLLPLKQMDSEVHGRMSVSRSKIDTFDVRILPDMIHLYWITTPNKSIQKLTTTTLSSNFKRKAKRAAEQEAADIATTIENPKSLAIDWIGERIYILDANNHQVVTTDLNGNGAVTIVASGAQPIDIVVEPSLRKIFWSTLDNGILSASMDGTDKQVIKTNHIFLSLKWNSCWFQWILIVINLFEGFGWSWHWMGYRFDNRLSSSAAVLGRSSQRNGWNNSTQWQKSTCRYTI